MMVYMAARRKCRLFPVEKLSTPLLQFKSGLEIVYSMFNAQDQTYSCFVSAECSKFTFMLPPLSLFRLECREFMTQILKY